MSYVYTVQGSEDGTFTVETSRKKGVEEAIVYLLNSYAQPEPDEITVDVKKDNLVILSVEDRSNLKATVIRYRSGGVSGDLKKKREKFETDDLRDLID